MEGPQRMEHRWNHSLAEQLDWHWREQLRPRFEGLTDDEYFWEPVPHCWTVRPTGTAGPDFPGAVTVGSGDFTIDFALPEPVPPPVTTIAWRIAHMVVGVLGGRNASHFGGPATDYFGHNYAGTAAAALAQLDEAYERWLDGVHGLGEQGLFEQCGPAEGPWSEAPMLDLVLHINREMIHHGAEVSLLRDLYAHRGQGPA
jgi:hypothetical protein